MEIDGIVEFFNFGKFVHLKIAYRFTGYCILYTQGLNFHYQVSSIDDDDLVEDVEHNGNIFDMFQEEMVNWNFL